MSAERCLGGARHWFTVYGRVGRRSPICRRCGSPNPRPLSAAEMLAYREARGEVGVVLDGGRAREWASRHQRPVEAAGELVVGDGGGTE
jgi:hypothetical protein